MHNFYIFNYKNSYLLYWNSWITTKTQFKERKSTAAIKINRQMNYIKVSFNDFLKTKNIKWMLQYKKKWKVCLVNDGDTWKTIKEFKDVFEKG